MNIRRHIPRTVRWVVLTLVGWLAYALLRALWTIICLGAPAYDWVWYLPVVALLIALPVYIAWRLPLTRIAFFTFAGLVGMVLVSYNGFGQVVYLQPGRAMLVPISFWGSVDYPEAVLQDIQATRGYLYVCPNEEAFEGERGQALAAGLRRLAEHRIEVYLCPPVSDFLSVPVYREWITSTHRAATFIRREGLTNVRGLIGDAEPPGKVPLDIAGIHQAEFAQAALDLRDLIGDVHSEYPGLQIGVTATGPHYLDELDGDADLSVVMRSPVDPPGGWDFINMMTYSSYFPPDWRAYYVYVAERAMARRYPTAQVSHLIGLIGCGLPWEPLLDFTDLVRDARLSRALGVREIVVFHLDCALSGLGNDFVQRLMVAVNGSQSDVTVAVPFSRPVSVLFYGIAAADALLDARGWRGLLWIGWAILSGIIVRYVPAANTRRMLGDKSDDSGAGDPCVTGDTQVVVQ
jgi:hypothetical protein